MRKLVLIFLVFGLTGCASTVIPMYIQDKNTYKKEFYVSFDEAYTATVAALEELGWKITKATDPSEYERVPVPKEKFKGILLITDVRQTSMFIGTRYARINIFIHEIAENSTEVDIRYLTSTSILFKTWTSYHNDSATKRIQERIEQQLN